MTTATLEQNPLFFHAIAANAAFSTLCGVIMGFMPLRVAGWLGVGRSLDIQAIGFFLIGFAAFLLVSRWRGRLPRWLAWSVVAGDFGWVLYSAVLLAAFGSSFSVLGQWLVLDVALVVGVFGGLQARGLWRSGVPVTS